MSEQAGKNTDIEIWRKVPLDYYSPSIRVTENGDIRICLGGYVLTAPVERWFAAGEIAFCVKHSNERKGKDMENEKPYMGQVALSETPMLSTADLESLVEHLSPEE